MKYRFILLFLISCNIFLPATNAQQDSSYSQLLTLSACIQKAIENNQQVREAAYQAQIDGESYKQAKASQLPSLNAGISHGINQGRSIDPYTNTYASQQINFANYSINTGVTIWNGAALRNNIRSNEYAFKASEMDWQQAKDNITINVILAYLQVLTYREQLSIAQSQVAVTKAQVDRLEILNKNGAIAPSTLYDLKGQLSGDELNVINTRNSLATARLSLAQLMNIPYQDLGELETLPVSGTPVLYDGDADRIYQTALDQLAIVKAAGFRRQSAEKRYQSAKAQLLPTLSFNGAFGTNYSSVASRQNLIGTSDAATSSYVNISGSKVPVFAPQNTYSSQKISYGDQWSNNLNSSLSIGLQIPILNGRRARTNMYQAKIFEKRSGFEEQTVKTQLHQAVDQAYINMQAAQDRLQALQKQLDDFQESFLAAEVRFNSGVTTSVEYLIAKNNVDKTRNSYISAKYDYYLRLKVLDFYQGKPLR